MRSIRCRTTDPARGVPGGALSLARCTTEVGAHIVHPFGSGTFEGILHLTPPRHTVPTVSDRDAYHVLHVRADAHPLVIQAAYRTLAALYHPDRTDSPLASAQRMAELNDAYAKLRNPDSRAAYDAQLPHVARESVVVMPVRARAEAVRARADRADASPAGGRHEARTGGIVDFGRYQGWTIRALARHDPDYLRWLKRHSAGTRFRSEIDSALADVPIGPSVSEKVLGRR